MSVTNNSAPSYIHRPHAQYELFATGAATGVEINGEAGIASPVHCHFLKDA